MKDLNYFLLNELIRSLMIYEMIHIEHDVLENNLPKNKKDLILQTIEDHLSDN